MNARFYSLKSGSAAALAGALIAALSLSASAQAPVSLDERAPIHATLMPEVEITANASDPAAPARWSIANTRPTPVTLMPTLTVRPDMDSIAASTFQNVIAVAGVQSVMLDAMSGPSLASRQDRVLFTLAD